MFDRQGHDSNLTFSSGGPTDSPRAASIKMMDAYYDIMNESSPLTIRLKI